MTTKEQERKALEQIRKIVEGLGENSYIGFAFEGCFEIAEENIENDWGCSMKQRLEQAEFAEDELRDKVGALKKELDTKAHELAIANLRLEEMNKAYGTAQKNKEEWNVAYNRAQTEANETAAKLDEKEDEIIRLKAKLYDMMVK